MNNIVNLNRFRKKKRREKIEQKAEENRAKFGRTKGQMKKEIATKKNFSSHIDDHKLEKDERE